MNAISHLFPIVLLPISLPINERVPSIQNSLREVKSSSQSQDNAAIILGLALSILYSLVQYYYSQGQPNFIIPKNEDGSDWSTEEQLQWVKTQIKHPLLSNPITCVNAIYHNKISTSSNDVKALVRLIQNGSLQAFRQKVTLADGKQSKKWINIYVGGTFTKKILLHHDLVLRTEQGHEFAFRNINRSPSSNEIRKCLRGIDTPNIFF